MPFPSRGEILTSRYRIEELLGEGSFGRVYLARDIRADEDVAVKVLKAEGEGAEDRILRFDREIKTLGSLEHPNILRYIDHGRQADVIFLVVELLRGRDLDTAGPDFAGQSERVLMLGSRLARAFAAAHAKGILHRDIKPENIHLTETGEPRILDYGLAGWDALAGEDGEEMGTVQRLTKTNEMMGTVPYMSPEQIRAEQLDRRTDIFSLAVVLYELVTGRRPYLGGSIVELLLGIEKGNPPNLSAIRPELTSRTDEALGAVLCKALDPLAHERFQTMEELALALETALGEGSSIPEDASPAILLPPRATLAERNVRTMVGRDAMLDTLGERLTRARDGAGAVTFLEAPAGMGKSLLVNELVRKAHGDGWLCLTSLVHRSRKARNEHPLRPWIERAAEVFPRDVAVQTAHHALEVAERDVDEPAEDALGRAVGEALVALAQRMPVLLVLEDAHLGEASALAPLEVIAETVREHSVALLLTTSPDVDAEVAASERLLRAAVAGGAERLALMPLSATDLAQMAADIYPGLELSGPLLESFRDRSGGNPLYATAILRLLEENGGLLRDGAAWTLGDVREMPHPPEARELLDARLRDLEPSDIEILETAAALEREFTPERVAEVMQVEPDDVSPRLRFLDVRKNILFREQEGYRFDQPLTREFLLQRLDPERSRELHLRAARTLEARLKPRNDGSDVDVRGSIASHFMQAGRPADALPHLLGTGLQRRAENDHLEAVSWLEKACAVIEREIDRQHSSERLVLRGKLGDAEFALGDSLHRLGRHGEALRHLEDARRIAAQLKSQPLRARALLALASVYLARGDVLQAQRRARQAERASRKSSLDAELATALSIQATATSRLGDDPEEAEEMWGEALEILDALGNASESAETRFRLGNHFFRLDRYDDALDCYREAASRIDRTAEPQRFARILNARAAVALARRRPDRALPAFEEAAAIRRAAGARRGEAATLHNIGYCHHMLGRLDEARETYERVIALRAELDEPSARASSQRNLSEVLFDMGRLGEALDNATESLDAKRQLEDLGYVPNCLNMLGEIELQLGRLERARRAFDEVLGEHRDESRDERIAALAGIGHAEFLAGQAGDAARHFDDLERELTEGEASLDDLRLRFRLLRFRIASDAPASAVEVAAAPFDVTEDDEGLLVSDRLTLLHGRGLIAGRAGDAEAAARLLGQALAFSELVGAVESRWRLHEELAAYSVDRRGAHLRAARALVDGQVEAFASEELREAYLAHPRRAALVAATRDLDASEGADSRWTGDAMDRETLG